MSRAHPLAPFEQEILEKIVIGKMGKLYTEICLEDQLYVRDPDGTASVGAWLKKNSDAIYGTTASVFERLPFFGRCTVKGTTLYIHVMGWPKDAKIRLPGLKTDVVKAYLLADRGKPVPFSRSGKDIVIALPQRASDPDATVVAVELLGPPVVEPYTIEPGALSPAA